MRIVYVQDSMQSMMQPQCEWPNAHPGLLPFAVCAQQKVIVWSLGKLDACRVVMQLNDECPNDLSKYELLAQLAATNVSLLYYVLIHNLEMLAPIVYTPTVGEACQKFDRIFR